MKRFLLVAAASLALASCATTASQAPRDWDAFAQTTVDEWLAIDPAFAVYQGAHQYDGKLPDWSDAGLEAREVVAGDELGCGGAGDEDGADDDVGGGELGEHGGRVGLEHAGGVAEVLLELADAPG